MNNRTLKKYALAIAAFSVFGLAPMGSAYALKQIQITENVQMNVGKVGVTASGGTVTISPSGTVTAPTGFFLSGSTSAGQFTATGQISTPVQISFSPGTLTGPGQAITIDNFTTNAGPSPAFDGSGNLTFSVGASIVIAPTQQGGSYSGTYSVTVIY